MRHLQMSPLQKPDQVNYIVLTRLLCSRRVVKLFISGLLACVYLLSDSPAHNFFVAANTIAINGFKMHHILTQLAASKCHFIHAKT